jgi:hypothetical protein
MKKAAFVLTAMILAIICISFNNTSSAQNDKSSRAEKRKLKKMAEQAVVKKAVESRRYVIKVNRLYSNGAAFYEMVPTSNFLIVNGEFTSISLGYIGRSFGSRPITGINMNGQTYNYKMQDNESKGVYSVQMSVKYGSDKFDIYLSIGASGNCDITINNPYIQSIRYEGNLEPIPASMPTPPAGVIQRM